MQAVVLCPISNFRIQFKMNLESTRRMRSSSPFNPPVVTISTGWCKGHVLNESDNHGV